MIKKKASIVLAAVLALLQSISAGPGVLEDFENIEGWEAFGGRAAFEKAESAAVGKGAIHVTLPGRVFKQLSLKPLAGSASWDKSEGISFMVKGDGSDLFGCLALGERRTGPYSYVYYFSLKNTDWQKITVPWSKMIPEGQVNLIGEPGALPPSGIKALRFGSVWSIYFNNAKIPLHSYSIDQVQIEDKVEKKSEKKYAARDISTVLDLLKNRKPVHIVCIGDSITAGSGLPNKDTQRYATITQNVLREWLGYDDIIVESRAVGGAKSTDGRAWLNRDFVGKAPDLVTIMYGYNDKSAAYTRPFFKNSMNDYIERLVQETEGKTAILPFATTPGTGPRYVMMDDFAESVREITRERGLMLFDLNRIMKKISRDKIQSIFVDQAHPNVKGHEMIGNELANFLVKSAGISTPKPMPKAAPKVVPGEALSWSFDDGGGQDWKLSKGEVSVSTEKASSGKSAIKFQMPAPGKDHRRAYSPGFVVSEGQEYKIEAKVFCSKAESEAIALYASSYANVEFTGKGAIKLIRSASNSIGKWETVSGTYTVPPGIVSMKIMLWSSSNAAGVYYIDDLKVSPISN